MGDWREVIVEQEVPENAITKASAGNLQLVLLRDAGEIFAYHDECPHEKHPLSKGKLEGEVLVCAKHLWEFQVRTGEHITKVPMAERNLLRYPVRVVNGKVEVDVSSPERWAAK